MLTDEKRQKLLAALGGLDADELREAKEHVRQLLQAKNATKRFQFHVGQRVEFASTKRGLVQGVVTSIEAHSVLVDADEKGQWRVSPEHLRPVGDG